MNTVVNGASASEAPVIPEHQRRWDEVLAAAETPDLPALLARYVNDYPNFYRYMTSLNVIVCRSWARALYGEALGIGEAAIDKQAETVEQSLLTPDSSEIEFRLARQAGEDWLQLRILTALGASNLGSVAAGRIHRLMDGAHRRYNRTLRTLATVRRLCKGLEVRVTHENAPAATPLQGARMAATAEEREVQATEQACLRTATVAARLHGLVPEPAV